MGGVTSEKQALEDLVADSEIDAETLGDAETSGDAETLGDADTSEGADASERAAVSDSLVLTGAGEMYVGSLARGVCMISIMD